VRRRHPLSQGSKPLVPVTPLIDIVFLLLIYFMLASNFVTEQQMVVDLPESSHGVAVRHVPTIISITADGTFYLNGQRIVADSLVTSLSGIPRQMHLKELEIRAQRDTPVYLVIQAMDAARETGFTKIRVETRLKEPR